jgi:hypothetical protein
MTDRPARRSRRRPHLATPARTCWPAAPRHDGLGSPDRPAPHSGRRRPCLPSGCLRRVRRGPPPPDRDQCRRRSRHATSSRRIPGDQSHPGPGPDVFSW